MQIYELKPDDTVVPPDDPTGTDDPKPADIGIDEDPEANDKPKRYVVDNVEVRVATERVQYLDEHGKLVNESTRGFATKIMQAYAAWVERIRR